MKRKNNSLKKDILIVIAVAAIVFVSTVFVPKLFEKSKKEVFLSEAQNIFKSAKEQYLKDVKNNNSKTDNIYTNQDSKSVNIKNDDKVGYLIQFDKDGNVIYFIASNEDNKIELGELNGVKTVSFNELNSKKITSSVDRKETEKEITQEDSSSSKTSKDKDDKIDTSIDDSNIQDQLQNIKVKKLSYTEVEYTMSSGIVDKGYIVDSDYVTISLGLVNTDGYALKVVSVSSFGRSANVLVSVTTPDPKLNQAQVLRTPAIKIFVDKISSYTITVQDQYGHPFNQLKTNQSYFLGDIDMDNEITLNDSLLLRSYLLGGSDLSKYQIALADTNKDGKVDLKDVEEIDSFYKSNKTTANSSLGDYESVPSFERACKAGYYRTNSSMSCTICPANTFSLEGAKKCTSCPSGTCSKAGSTSLNSCVKCEPTKVIDKSKNLKIK